MLFTQVNMLFTQVNNELISSARQPTTWWRARTQASGLAWISADLLQHFQGVYRICIYIYAYPPWVLQLSDFVRFCQILFPSKPVVGAIEVSHAACKDEFRQNPRSHSCRFFNFYNIVYLVVCMRNITKYHPAKYICWYFVALLRYDTVSPSRAVRSVCHSQNSLSLDSRHCCCFWRSFSFSICGCGCAAWVEKQHGVPLLLAAKKKMIRLLVRTYCECKRFDSLSSGLLDWCHNTIK